jgi:cytochrome oxidase Cu insertion factor (SCO1/SenC/PrrC family)
MGSSIMEGMSATVRVGAALVAFAIVALACTGPQTEQSASSSGSEKANRDLPAGGDGASRDFSVTSFTGKDFTLSDQRGSPVVLNFFESW